MFKKSTLFVSIIISLGILLFMHSKNEEGSAPATISKLDKKSYPNDFFMLQRSYPDEKLDINAYLKAQREVQKDMEKAKVDTIFWDQEGPNNIGGRIASIAVHPQDQNIIYAGSAKGGVFKTTDGGENWLPLFDDLPSLAVSCVVIDPGNPETVYVGTGDKDISRLPSIGDGIYKSEDGGNTWQHLGLEEQRIIARIAVHPLNSNIIYAATMGLPFERNNERGLYKSENGGANWEQVLFISDQTGAIDVVVDPTDLNIVYASTWDRIRNNKESLVSGPGSGFFKSTDGGASWQPMAEEFTDGENSRTGISIDPNDPQHLAAIVVADYLDNRYVIESFDGGSTWENIGEGDVLSISNGFGWYFGQIRINPFQPDEIYVLGVPMFKYADGAWQYVAGYEFEMHVDFHDLVFLDEQTSIVATDGGLYRSNNYGLDWFDFENISNTQFYRVQVNPHQDGEYWGGTQDNGTISNTGNNEWERRYWGDGFQVRFNPTNESIVYASSQNGALAVSTDGGYNFSDYTQGLDGRRNWDTRYFISPHNSEVLYTATHRMYRSDNPYSANWNAISPDLTDGEIFSPSMHTISAIAESEVQEGFLYVGTTDGNVQRSLDGGLSWQPVYSTLPDRYVTDLKTSYTNPMTVYVCHSGYKDNDNFPHIHRSDDAGDSWQPINGDLPNIAINDIAVYPFDDNFIFVATDGGVYYTENAGINWQRLGHNMPVMLVFDVEFDLANNRLIAGTYARSMWSIALDEIVGEISNVESLGFRAHIFPNPFTNRVVIECDRCDKDVAYSLLNLNGQRLVQGGSNIIETRHLPAGTYFLEIASAEDRAYHKLIKN